MSFAGPPAGYSDLEAVPEQADKIVLENPKPPDYPPKYLGQYSDAPPPKPRRRLLWTLVAVGIVLVIIGAVLGGVLGTRAKQTADVKSAAPAESLSSSTLTTSTTPTSVTLTTSTEVGPTQTLYPDCPSSNYTVYNAVGSLDFQFRKLCTIGFVSNNNDMINKKTSNFNDCIDLCATYNLQNKTEIQSGASPVCNEVCWRHSVSSDLPGQCFGSTMTTTSTGDFPHNTEGIECERAAWINHRF